MQIEKIQITYTDGRVEYVDSEKEAVALCKTHLREIIKEEGLKKTQIVFTEDMEEVILLVDGETHCDCIICPMLIDEQNVAREIAKAEENNGKILAHKQSRREVEEELDIILNCGSLQEGYEENEKSGDMINVPAGADPYDYIVEL